jgi:hypothetical protein
MEELYANPGARRGAAFADGGGQINFAHKAATLLSSVAALAAKVDGEMGMMSWGTAE